MSYEFTVKTTADETYTVLVLLDFIILTLNFEVPETIMDKKGTTTNKY